MYKLLQRQQAIMSVLGLYSGRCDGAWGPETIAAKIEWESRDDFDPAVISRGAPFAPGCKLPKGFSWLSGKIISTKVKEADIQAAITKTGGLLTSAEVHKHIFPEEVKATEVKAVQSTQVKEQQTASKDQSAQKS